MDGVVRGGILRYLLCSGLSLVSPLSVGPSVTTCSSCPLTGDSLTGDFAYVTTR